MVMKVIKKNQLAILVISLMLITAGYLNYNTNYGSKDESMDTSVKPEENVNLAELGDAELVSTNITEEQEVQKPEATVEIPEDQKEKKEEKKTESGDSYFTASKLERNVMYSQMIERYQEMIANSSQITEQKAIAQQEINKINELQNAIMIAENLLTSKGFPDNIIFVNGNSVSVIIGKGELGVDEIAQIQNIVSREIGAELEKIHISMK